jgi:NADPH:quinone reductase-like Zn-dependent oxidoreductase
MRALIVDDYGESPRLAEVPTPEANAGKILIRVGAAGTNPMDRENIAKRYWEVVHSDGLWQAEFRFTGK